MDVDSKENVKLCWSRHNKLAHFKQQASMYICSMTVSYLTWKHYDGAAQVCARLANDNFDNSLHKKHALPGLLYIPKLKKHIRRRGMQQSDAWICGNIYLVTLVELKCRGEETMQNFGVRYPSETLRSIICT